jgi:hypothetical protein
MGFPQVVEQLNLHLVEHRHIHTNKCYFSVLIKHILLISYLGGVFCLRPQGLHSVNTFLPYC